MKITNIAALACLAVCTSAALAADWPQWRGPARDGISKETGLLKEWPKDGPKLAWQVKTLGYGFGTPAVVGDRLYLQSNEGDDAEFVKAISAKDGKPIWSTKIGKVGAPKQMPSYPGARGTPTVDGDMIYALSSDGDIACLEAKTGNVRWNKNVQTEFGGKMGIWAYSESPLIDGDKVVVTPGGATSMVALHKKTGAVLWKTVVPAGGQAAYSSIVTTEIGGVKQYVQFLQNALIGVDAKNGNLLWRYDKTAEPRMGANIPTPVAYDGFIYSASGMVGGGLCHIKASNGGFDAEQVYLAKKMPSAIGGTVRLGDYLYGTSGQTLTCLEFKTGSPRWEERCVGPGSVAFADGRLYVHGENGDVALVEATPEGYRERGKFTPSEQPDKRQARAWCYPVIANGRLYIRDLGTLWCYDVKAH